MPNNPYIAGNPVGKTQAFVGREDVLREVMRVIKNPSQNAIALYGQRRIGKTSILQYLTLHLPEEGAYKPVYFDLQDKAAMTLDRVLEELARTIALVCGNSELNLGDNVEATFRSQWLPEILQGLKEKEKLVLLFDEFDILADPRGDQAAKAFFPYLRSLLELDLQSLEFVFVLGRRIDDLDSIALSVFKGIPAYRVSLLTRKDTELLARIAERNKSLHWTEEAIACLWDLTHGHPYLTQQLCSQIWDTLYTDEPEMIPEVTVKSVEDAVQKALDASRNALEWLWNGLPPAERVVISALAEAGFGTISQERLEEVLYNSGVRVLIRELHDAPALLTEWDLIESDGDGKGYAFRVELLRRWLAANKPLSRVQAELDRLIPVADGYYQTAQGIYAQGNLDEAARLLRQAVAQNPNHLRANELLAEILITQNAWDEAHKLLEHLYEINPAVARPRLAQVLAVQADGIKDEAERLKVYDRILELEPRRYASLRESAEKIRSALRARELAPNLEELDQLQGENRFEEARVLAEKLSKNYPEQQDWEKIRSALRAREFAFHFAKLELLQNEGQYEEAERLAQKLSVDFPDQQDWEKIRSGIRSQGFKHQYAELEHLQNEKHYEEAFSLAKKLSMDFPEQLDWKEPLLQLEKLSRISEIYQRALGALNSNDRPTARRLFAEVVGLDPEYEEASNYLNKAVRDLDALELQKKHYRVSRRYRISLVIGVMLLLCLGGAVIGYLVKDQSAQDYRSRYEDGQTRIEELSTWAAPPIARATETELAETSGLLRTLRVPDGAHVTGVAYSSDGIKLAVGSDDSAVRVWDLRDESPDAAPKEKSFSSAVTSIAFSPVNVNIVAVGLNDNTIALWNLLFDTASRLEGHTATVTSVAFSSDGKLLVSGSEDGTVRLWDVASATLLNILNIYNGAVNSVAFSPTDSNLVAIGMDDSTIRLWTIDNHGGPTLTRALKGHTSRVKSVAFSPDGKILATGSNDYTVRLWNVSDDSQISELQDSYYYIFSVAFSPNGTMVASGLSYNGVVELWNSSDGNLIKAMNGHSDSVVSVMFSPDGSQLATGSKDGTIRIWSVK